MSTARARVVTAAGIAFGAMWLVAAGAKLASPQAAFELVSRMVPPGVPPKAALAVAIALETALGVAMCLRAVRGFVWSLAGLLAMSAALLFVRAHMGTVFPCGCFGKMMGSTLDVALGRNAVLVACHAALIVWTRRAPAAKA